MPGKIRFPLDFPHPIANAVANLDVGENNGLLLARAEHRLPRRRRVLLQPDLIRLHLDAPPVRLDGFRLDDVKACQLIVEAECLLRKTVAAAGIKQPARCLPLHGVAAILLNRDNIRSGDVFFLHHRHCILCMGLLQQCKQP